MAESIVVGTLRALLTADSADFNREMQKAVKTTQDVDSKFQAVGKSIAAAGKLFAGAFAATAVIGAAKQVIDFAGNLTDLAAKTGISTTGLQKLNLAFEQSGVTLDEVSRASGELGARLASGDKSAIAAVQKLGLSVNDLLKMKPEDQFLAVGDAVGQLQNKGEQLAVSKTLFGKSGADLLQGLTGNLRETTAEFESMGLIMDEQTVKAADDFGDKLGLLGKQLMGVVANIVGPLLPALSLLMDMLSKVGAVVGKLVGFFFKNLFGALANLQSVILNFLATVADAATRIPILGKHLMGLGDAADWLRGQAERADKMAAQLLGTTEETGEAARAAAPPVLDLADNAGRLATSAKKAADEQKKWNDTTNEATAGLSFMLAKLQVMPGAVESMNASLHILGSTTVDLSMAMLGVPWTQMNQHASRAVKDAENVEKATGGMVTGMQSSFKSLMEGLTGKKGLDGFFQKLGSDIVAGFGNILSGGIASAVNLGVSLALKGIAKIAGLLKGLFQSEESKHVNQPRDQFFAQYGGLEGLHARLGGVVSAGQADELTRALFSADTVARFKDAQRAIIALIGGDLFRTGTPNLGFTDFGLGSAVMLHGREAVVPESRKAEAVMRWGGGAPDQVVLTEIRDLLTGLSGQMRWRFSRLAEEIKNGVGMAVAVAVR